MADTRLPDEQGPMEQEWHTNQSAAAFTGEQWNAVRMVLRKADYNDAERDTLIGELGRALETVNEAVNNIQQTGHADLWDEIGRLNGAVTELREQVEHLLEHHNAEAQPDAPDAPEQPEPVCGGCVDWNGRDCTDPLLPQPSVTASSPACKRYAERTDPEQPEEQVCGGCESFGLKWPESRTGLCVARGEGDSYPHVSDRTRACAEHYRERTDPALLEGEGPNCVYIACSSDVPFISAAGKRTDPAPSEPEVAELVEWAKERLGYVTDNDRRILDAMCERLLQERPRVGLTEGQRFSLEWGIDRAQSDDLDGTAEGLRQILAMYAATTDAPKLNFPENADAYLKQYRRVVNLVRERCDAQVLSDEVLPFLLNRDAMGYLEGYERALTQADLVLGAALASGNTWADALSGAAVGADWFNSPWWLHVQLYADVIRQQDQDAATTDAGEVQDAQS